MCLAKAYLRPPDVPAAEDGQLVMENVTRVDVEDDQIRLRSLLGDTETLRGRVASIDFAAGILVVQT
jgi:predicted RNA-binding protein